jgi:hypothetical protein
MSGRWPFKKIKPNLEASSSRKKMWSPPPKKTRDRPYLNVVMSRVLHRDNMLVGVRNVHLSNGWLLNTRRVSVPLVPRHEREWHDKIHHRRAILPQDQREDLAFSTDSMWWELG